MIVEALAKIAISEKKRYIGREIRVCRIPLTDVERRNFKYGLLRRHSESLGSYGFLKLPLFALDAIFTKVTSWFGRKEPIFFFTKYIGISNIPVCSQLVVWGLHNLTSYRLRNMYGEVVNWRCVSPDYLDDLLQLEINHAEILYESVDTSAPILCFGM